MSSDETVSCDFERRSNHVVNNFKMCDSLSSNSIFTACMTPTVFIHSPIRQWWRSVLV